MERRQKEVFNQILPEFTRIVDPIQLLPYLDCLTDHAKEQIQNLCNNRSNNWANQELHSALLRRPQGFHHIVLALEHNYSFLADRLDPDRAIRGPPFDQQTSSHSTSQTVSPQSTTHVDFAAVRPQQSYAQEQITAATQSLSTPPVHFTTANTSTQQGNIPLEGLQQHPHVMPNNQYQNTYEMPYQYQGPDVHPGMRINQFQGQYHQPYLLPHVQGQPYYTNIMPNQYQGQTALVPGQFQGQPWVPGQFQGQPSMPGQVQGQPSVPGQFLGQHSMPGQFQGQPWVPGQFQGQPSVPGQFQGQPLVPGQFQGQPSLISGQVQEHPSAVPGHIQGQPAQFQGYFQGPHEHPTNPFDQFQGTAQYFYATPKQEQGLIYHRIPISQQDSGARTESSLITPSMSSGIPTLTSESLKHEASKKSQRPIEQRSFLSPGQSLSLGIKSKQLLETYQLSLTLTGQSAKNIQPSSAISGLSPANIQPSSAISSQSPGNIQPSSAISGQSPGNLQPSLATSGQSPGNLQPSSATSGQSPGNLQPSSAISGQSPGILQPSSAISGQSPGNIQPSSAISGQSLGNIQPSPAISGQSPGNILPSSAISGQSLGNLQPSSAIYGQSPGNIQPSSAISGQSPGNIQPSSAIYGQSPGNIQPSSAISGQSLGNLQPSSTISGQSPGYLQPSSSISGKSPGNLQLSSAISGQSPGNFQPSGAISGQSLGNLQPSSAISGQSPGYLQPSSSISGKSPGNLQPSSAISGQSPGNFQPSSAISGQSTGNLQPSSAISGQSPGNFQPSSAISGQSTGNLQHLSAISGQSPGNFQPSSAISGQSTANLQPSSAISGKSPGNLQPLSGISGQSPGNIQPYYGQSQESIQPAVQQPLTQAQLSQPDLPIALHECPVDLKSERSTQPSQLSLHADAASRVQHQRSAHNILPSQESHVADAAELQPLTSGESPQAPVARETFKSSFCENFKLIKVLGKGAFGVVFEAAKLFDLQHYAVKRIKIKGKDAETTMMPEVLALARLNHPRIVRYFNAWMETPPLGWQAEQDSHVVGLSSLTCTDDYPTETTSSERQSDDETSKKQPGAFTVPPRNAQLADLHNFGANNFTDCLDDDVPPHDKANESSGWSTDEGSSIDAISKETKDDDDNEEEKEDENDENEEGKEYEQQENKEDDEDDDNGIVFETSETSRKRKTDKVQKKARYNHDDSTEGGGSIDRRAHDLDRLDQRLQQLSNSQPSLPVPPTFLYIQTELCKAETLKDWLDKTKIRPPNEILKIVIEITSALAYIHEMKYIHRDLKPANIFFAFDNSVKLGDFGLAKIMAVDQVGSLDEERVAKSLTTGVGTYFYMSPEQSGKKYTNKVDIFALGVILFEMFHSFDSGSERAKMLEAARKQDFPEQFQVNHVQWCDTVRQMLSTDPDDRPTAQQLLHSDLLRT